MKFTCTKKKILKAISLLDTIVNGKVIYNIESNILFKLENNTLKLVATDGSRYGVYTIEVDSNDSGSVLCYSKKLLGIIKEMQDGLITFEVEDNEKINIYSENRKSKHLIIGMKSDDYPKFDYIDCKYFALDSKLFLAMVNKVKDFIGKEPFKPALRGFLLKKENNILTIVSTDGRCMAIYDKPLEVDVEDFDVIVEGSIIGTLNMSVNDDVNDIQIGISKDNIIFDINNFYLVDSLIESKYPNYTQVIPREYNYNFQISKSDILKAIKNIVPMINDVRSKRMILSISENNIQVKGVNSEIGESIVDLDIEYTSEAFTVAYNYSYLLNIINALDSEILYFNINSGSVPTMIKGFNDDYYYIIMPMSIGED